MTKLISPQRARQLAYDWHGGMWSPLYAFASSGLVEDPALLLLEIQDCMNDALDEPAQIELEQLKAFVLVCVQPTEPGARWKHYAAPWADPLMTQTPKV